MTESAAIFETDAAFAATDKSSEVITGSKGVWTRVPIARIEDLADAVYGAGLQVTQMSREPVKGSLAFAEQDGVLFSSGFINGRVTLIGPLSTSNFTLGIGLKMPPKNRQWLREVESGAVGLFMPGDEHHALHFPGALYASLTISEERIEQVASHADVVLEPRKLGGSGIDKRRISIPDLQMLNEGFNELHAGRSDGTTLPGRLLDCIVNHFGRAPRTQVGAAEYRGYSRIVRRGLDHIHGNLHRNLTVEKVAIATGTSSRTLFRAFHAILGEGPLAHINRLRLHRIRHDLLNADHSTVTAIASRWNVTELGRFSGAYKLLFGELPSQTVGRVGTMRATERTPRASQL